MQPVYSIITPSLNCGAFIARNLASVQEQRLKSSEVEHWVIDGGSTDGTLEILRKNPAVKFISEKDRGLAHAVNKGIEKSTGQWIIWLNADDALAPGSLTTFLDFSKNFPDNKIFAGDQNIYDYRGAFECLHPGWAYTFQDLLNKNTDIAQASTFVHRTVYEKVGLLDENFRYAMDYEWFVRAAKSYEVVHLPAVLTHYHRRPGSIMDAGIYGQHQDILRTRRLHNCSQLSTSEFKLRFYLATQPLRRIYWLRSMVRSVKSLFGLNLQHRYEAR